jgi:hypothetical protein
METGPELSAADQELISTLKKNSELDIGFHQGVNGPSKEWWSAENAMTMCSAILLFGLVVILLGSRLALKNLDKDTILKIVVIPMAIMSAIFLVVAGYSDSQIAPAIGLLGTIVGYVLGTARNPSAIVPEKEGSPGARDAHPTTSSSPS